jgi:hypothetical protein
MMLVSFFLKNNLLIKLALVGVSFALIASLASCGESVPRTDVIPSLMNDGDNRTNSSTPDVLMSSTTLFSSFLVTIADMTPGGTIKHKVVVKNIGNTNLSITADIRNSPEWLSGGLEQKGGAPLFNLQPNESNVVELSFRAGRGSAGKTGVVDIRFSAKDLGEAPNKN